MAIEIDDDVEITQKGRKLTDLVKAGIKARDARFGKTAKELEVYDFSDKTPWETNWDENLSFMCKVHKTTQFKREIGSRLFNERPNFRVEAQPWSPPESQVRSAIMEAYLNYSAGENDLVDNVEHVMMDGLGYGRGVLWFGLHSDKDGVVSAVHDSWKNLVLDPDPRKASQINWCARIRRKSRRWLLKNYADKKASILTMSTGENEDDDDGDAVDTGSEMVTFYEVWMKVGLHHYRGSKESDVTDSDGEEADDPVDEPRKYVVGCDGTILYDGEWETPYHVDGRWPFLPLDFYHYPNSVWPDSPLRPGLPWLRALNMVATVMLAKYRLLDGRTIIAIANNAGIKLSEEDIEALVYSDKPVDIIQPVINSIDGNVDIDKFIKPITMKSNMQADMAVFQHLSDMFEKETGLYEFLFVGQPSMQDRSAMATQVRDRNSMSRIDFMRSKMENFLSQAARMMALTARYHLDDADIRPILGPEAAQSWGMLMSAEDTDPATWVARYMQEGIADPELAMAMAQDTVAGAVSLEDWARETDFGIEVGTTVRRSPEQEAQFIDTANQQYVPILLQSGLYEAAGFFMGEQAKLMGASQEQIEALRASMNQMAMNQQQAAAQQAQQPVM